MPQFTVKAKRVLRLLSRAKKSARPAPSSALPWELLDTITDFCSGDTTTLCALALTCSQLHPRSILQLLAHVTLKHHGQLSKLEDTIRAHPDRGPMVQSLSYSWRVCSPFPLLSMLSGLCHLTFECIQATAIIGGFYDHHILRASSLRSLTVKNVSFESQSALSLFLSAFPTIQNLTCQSFNISGDVTPEESVRPRLLTLNLLPNVSQRAWRTLFQVAQLPASGVGKRSYTDCPTSLTWWIPTCGPIRDAINMLRSLNRSAIRDLTLVFWDRSMWSLYWTLCHSSVHLENLKSLEEILLRYQIHRVSFVVVGGVTLNVRKSISWLDEISKYLSALPFEWSFQDISSSGIAGHDMHVSALVISSDGRWVATASGDHTIILWDSQAGCISQEWFANGYTVSLALSPDGQHLASADASNRILIWDISNRARQVVSLKVFENGLPISLMWSSNGAYIALDYMLSDRPFTKVWSARGGDLAPLPLDDSEYKNAPPSFGQRRAMTLGHRLTLSPLHFSPDCRWLLTHEAHECRIWDLRSRACVDLPHARDDEPCVAAFSPSSTHAAVGYKDGTIRVWDLVTRAEHAFGVHLPSQQWQQLTFSPADDGLLLAVSTLAVRIWDAQSGVLVRSLDGHRGVVRAAHFSPCGAYVASASDDGTVKVWTARDGTCLATLSDHGAAVQHLAFTPDGSVLWSAAANGTVLARGVQDVVVNSEGA